jgi:hypothetical protein
VGFLVPKKQNGCAGQGRAYALKKNKQQTMQHEQDNPYARPAVYSFCGTMQRQLSIRNDEELGKLLGEATIAAGGVLPDFYSVLIVPKSKGKKEAEYFWPEISDLASQNGVSQHHLFWGANR